MSNWKELEPVLYAKCHDSMLNVRLPVLNELLSCLDDPEVSENGEVLERIANCILKTYNFYQDKESKS